MILGIAHTKLRLLENSIKIQINFATKTTVLLLLSVSAVIMLSLEGTHIIGNTYTYAWYTYNE